MGRLKAAVLTGGGVFLLAAILLALSAPASALAAPEGWIVTPLTSNAYDAAPQVSGDRIVWFGGIEGSDYEIFTWTPSGGIQQVTANAYGDWFPQVSGDRIVWYGMVDDLNHEIFTWTPTGGIQQLTSNLYTNGFPQVSGDRIVWYGGDGSDDEIFTWTPTGGIQQVTSNAYEDTAPQVSGDRIVWFGGIEGSDYEIFTWTPSGGIQQVTANAYGDWFPQVSGDRIVWRGGEILHEEIFTWTPSGGIQQLTSNTYADRDPRVSGDRIVWFGGEGTGSEYEIFTWTPSGGVQQLTSNTYADSDPRVSGDRIVWSGGVEGSDYEIFTWTPAGGTEQLTSNAYEDWAPQVSGDRIEWYGNADHVWYGKVDYEIFTAVPDPTVSILGSDRFDTALRISQAMYPASLPAGSGVVLAPGWESYQEALCGAPLAAAWGGPVLLSAKTVLYSGVAAELVRLGPDQVFCIGLTPALAEAVRAALPGATVTSINGALDDVYDMSRKVAGALEDEVGDLSGAAAIVTIGSNFPDAIGVSPVACAKKWPIILTDKAGGYPAPALHPSATATFTDLGITNAIKVGTYATLPAGVTGLANLSGTDRYDTNRRAAVWAQAYAGLTYAHVGVTTGDKFPDALASGPYLAKDHGTLLLSPLNGPLPAATGALITANQAGVQKVTFIACIEPVIGQVKALLP